MTEDELLSEFAKVMHEWGHKPFLRGEVRMPTLPEARYRLLRRCRVSADARPTAA